MQIIQWCESAHQKLISVELIWLQNSGTQINIKEEKEILGWENSVLNWSRCSYL